jgi:hypothetical protein
MIYLSAALTEQYRGLYKDSNHFPSTLPTLAANVAQMYAIRMPEPVAGPVSPAEPPTPFAVASAIRAALKGLRTDERSGLEWLACIAFSLEQAAISGQGQLVLPADGEVLINSNLRCVNAVGRTVHAAELMKCSFDWNIPFGFPWDQTAFHTAYSSQHVLRVYEANPERGQRFQEVGVELVFNVKKGMKERVEAVSREDRRAWLKS